jgi:hypothetical protein
MPTDHLLAVAPDPTACRIALSMLQSKSRKVWRNAPSPTDDQALAVACKFIDLGLDCDERHVQLAVALLKSRLTISELHAYSS